MSVLIHLSWGFFGPGGSPYWWDRSEKTHSGHVQVCKQAKEQVFFSLGPGHYLQKEAGTSNHQPGRSQSQHKAATDVASLSIDLHMCVRICMCVYVSLYWHFKSTWREVGCGRQFLISNLYPRHGAPLLICHHHPSATCTLPKLWLITDLLNSAGFMEGLRESICYSPSKPSQVLDHGQPPGKCVHFFAPEIWKVALNGQLLCLWEWEPRTEHERGHHGFFSGPRLAEDLGTSLI